jgi:hypothetical protein
MRTYGYSLKRKMQKYNNIKMHHAHSVDGQGTLQHCVKSVERMSSSGLPPCLWLPTTNETEWEVGDARVDLIHLPTYACSICSCRVQEIPWSDTVCMHI